MGGASAPRESVSRTPGPATEVSLSYAAVFLPGALGDDRNGAGTRARVRPSKSELSPNLGRNWVFLGVTPTQDP